MSSPIVSFSCADAWMIFFLALACSLTRFITVVFFFIAGLLAPYRVRSLEVYRFLLGDRPSHTISVCGFPRFAPIRHSR